MLGDRKEKALMIIIQRMITEYQNEKGSSEDMFEFFEDAKRIHHATSDTEFNEALISTFPRIIVISD